LLVSLFLPFFSRVRADQYTLVFFLPFLFAGFATKTFKFFRRKPTRAANTVVYRDVAKLGTLLTA
jgi:hypothetical protein